MLVDFNDTMTTLRDSLSGIAKTTKVNWTHNFYYRLWLVALTIGLIFLLYLLFALLVRYVKRARDNIPTKYQKGSSEPIYQLYDGHLKVSSDNGLLSFTPYKN